MKPAVESLDWLMRWLLCVRLIILIAVLSIMSSYVFALCVWMGMSEGRILRLLLASTSRTSMHHGVKGEIDSVTASASFSSSSRDDCCVQMSTPEDSKLGSLISTERRVAPLKQTLCLVPTLGAVTGMLNTSDEIVTLQVEFSRVPTSLLTHSDCAPSVPYPTLV